MNNLFEETYYQSHQELLDKFQEAMFMFGDLTDKEKDLLYKDFTDTYMKETGHAFDEYEFTNRAWIWKFYGDAPDENDPEKPVGGVAIREQRDGLCKLNACFGSFRSIMKGFTDLLDEHRTDPIWGLVTPKIRNMLCRGCKDFVIIPGLIIKLMEPLLKKLSHGAVQSIAMDGECKALVPHGNGETMTKVYVCNKAYVKWLVEQIENDTLPIPFPKESMQPLLNDLKKLAED